MRARGGWTPAADAEALSDGSLVVSGFMDEVLGIGRAARLIVDALERAGHSPVRHSARVRVRDMLAGAGTLPGDGGVWILQANPPEAEALWASVRPAGWARRYRIGSWAWETSLAPQAWARAAEHLNEIWAPSRFVADAVTAGFSAAGRDDLTDRIRLMPYPVRVTHPPAADRGRWGLPGDDVLFLMMFDGRSTFARKNPWGVLEAWTRAFPEPAMGRRLVIKTVRLDTDPQAAARLHAAIGGRTDITLIDSELDDAGTLSLIASCDAVLSLHRAEGFGLVMAEAMALGRPVIATGWSGNLDFMDADSAMLVPARTIPVNAGAGHYASGVWADPDLGQAAQAILAIADQPALRSRLGRAGVKRIAALNAPWTREALDQQPWSALVKRAA